MESYSRSSARGFTAIELIIVLIIGFSIIALSASKIGTMYDSSKSVSAVSSITDLTSLIHEMRSDDNSPKADNSALLKKFEGDGVLPRTLSSTGSKYYNNWGGEVTLKFTVADNTYTLVYPNVPIYACKKIVLATHKSQNFASINGGASGTDPLDATASNIDKVCTPIAKTKATTITFVVQ